MFHVERTQGGYHLADDAAMNIPIPIDLDRRHDFRLLLQDNDQDEALTIAIFFVLFRELAYLQREGHPVGVIPASCWPIVEQSLTRLQEDTPNGWRGLLVGPTRLLRPVEGGDEVVCPAYVGLVSEAQASLPSGGGIPALGTAVSKASRASRKLQQDPTLHLLLDPALFEGDDWPADLQQSAVWLVRSLDSVLERHQPRGNDEFTASLLRDAREALRLSGGQDKARQVLMGLAKLRVKEPMKFGGMRAEGLLPQWRQWMEAVKP